MERIFITIAICTWNRSRSLRNTLTSLQGMNVPAGIDWEVVVVNNNCTDDTAEVIGGFAKTLPIRTVLEAQQGHSYARNRAVVEARGDYILWTDDDVVVDAQWLVAYADAFRNWPDSAVFGGPISVMFEGTPPAWLVTALRQDGRLASAYAARDLGTEPISLEVKGYKLPFGANFALRMQEQRKVSYDPRFGLVKDGNVRGEETDVVTKILNSGANGRWIPNASVRHVIPEQRQTATYLRDYFMRVGRGTARAGSAPVSNSVMGAPRWVWRAAIGSGARYLLKRSYSSEIWCRELRDASLYWGMLSEYRNISRSRRLSIAIPTIK